MAMCEECKMNTANVKLTTIINGMSTTRHLCSDCAKKFNPNDISGVLAIILASMAAKETIPDIVCSNCRTTLSEFKTSGRLGCANCYTAFHEQLQPILLRIHGRVQHAGRHPPEKPETSAKKRRIEDLRKRLSDAVSVEDYETAARLRDEIKAVALTVIAGEND